MCSTEITFAWICDPVCVVISEGVNSEITPREKKKQHEETKEENPKEARHGRRRLGAATQRFICSRKGWMH